MHHAPGLAHARAGPASGFTTAGRGRGRRRLASSTLVLQSFLDAHQVVAMGADEAEMEIIGASGRPAAAHIHAHACVHL